MAYHIIGGGDEGDKTTGVDTKEQADHSLPYILAVAILDGKVTPEQYRIDRIRRPDVQDMLRRVMVSPNAAYSERFPNEMPCRIGIRLRDGRMLDQGNAGLPGLLHAADDMGHGFCEVRAFGRALFHSCGTPGDSGCGSELENTKVSDLMRLLAGIRLPHRMRKEIQWLTGRSHS